MALDRLLATLAREAEEEAAELVRAARERRATALLEAESAAAAQRAAHLAARERELAAQATLAVEQERRATRRVELEARAEAIEKVLARAARDLPRWLEQPRVRACLTALVTGALDDLDGGRATVRAAPALVAPLVEQLGGRDGVTVTADDVVGAGARIVVGDGALEIDVTLESELARMRARLAFEVARSITEGAP